MSDDLAERLRDEALVLHGISIERGSLDASISGMLEAAEVTVHLEGIGTCAMPIRWREAIIAAAEKGPSK